MKSVIAALLLAAATLRPPVPAQDSLELKTFDAAWDVINRTYYDATFNGLNWEAVRDELRPEAARARTPSELRAVIGRMIGRLGDSHFAVLPQSADPGDEAGVDRSGAPGFEFRPDGASLVVTRVDAASPAAKAGLHAGASIDRIGDTDVSTFSSRLPADMPPRLRALEVWRAAAMQLRGPIGTSVSVVARDAGIPRALVIERIEEPGQDVLLGNLPPLRLDVAASAVETPSGASAGVIAFNVWMAAADAPIAAAVHRFRGARGIVLDLRGNPGGLAGMIMGISGHFFEERTALGTMKMRMSSGPRDLTFYANPRRSLPDGTVVEPYDGPVAILIDGLTGSASECFAGGMQAVGRARVFGETSMGQALPASFTRLPNGDTLLHAIADFVTADGTRLEGRGVVPDVAVPLDKAALAAGRDPVLDAALAWIDGRR